MSSWAPHYPAERTRKIQGHECCLCIFMDDVLRFYDKEQNYRIAEDQSNVYPNKTNVERKLPFFQQKFHCGKGRFLKAWLEIHMEQAAIEEIDEWDLSYKGHVNENPIPDFIEIILFQLADEKYFGEIHLAQGDAEYY